MILPFLLKQTLLVKKKKKTRGISKLLFKKKFLGTIQAVQWLRLPTSNSGGADSIPGWGTKIPHAVAFKKCKLKKEKIS